MSKKSMINFMGKIKIVVPFNFEQELMKYLPKICCNVALANQNSHHVLTNRNKEKKFCR